MLHVLFLNNSNFNLQSQKKTSKQDALYLRHTDSAALRRAVRLLGPNKLDLLRINDVIHIPSSALLRSANDGDAY